MFQKTRLQLTAWYLLIIMAISIAFSAFIYIGANSEFNRVLRVQRFRIEHPEFQLQMRAGNTVYFQTIPKPAAADPLVLEEARQRVLFILLGVNGVILIFSSIAGYFLAGRTLRPIQEMIDEQNRFITDASHELNTPLTALKTAIEVNLRNKNLSISQAKKTLISNLEEVDNLQALSEELIELTRYQKPYQKITFEDILVKNVVTSAVQTVRILAEDKKISLQVGVEKMSVQGNNKMLTELFVILLDNAIKYSPEKSEISITAKKDSEKIAIAVADHGIGIAKEDLPYIFDRFYRADKSRTKQQVHGYGLGLSIAKRIVTLHNGTILLESNLGKGTTCLIQLPAHS